VAVRIETIAEPSDEVLVALNALLPQLNPAIVPPDRDRLARDSLQYVDAKLEASCMHICDKRRETIALRRGPKPVGRRNVAAVKIERIAEIRRVALCNRVGDKPLHIHDNVLPAVLLQMGSHPVCVRLYLRLPNRRPVRIPTVPSHRRRLRGRCGFAMMRWLPMQPEYA